MSFIYKRQMLAIKLALLSEARKFNGSCAIAVRLLVEGLRQVKFHISTFECMTREGTWKFPSARQLAPSSRAFKHFCSEFLKIVKFLNMTNEKYFQNIPKM